MQRKSKEMTLALASLLGALYTSSVSATQLFYICHTLADGSLKKIAVSLTQWEMNYKCPSSTPPSDCSNWLYSSKDACNDGIDNDCNGAMDDNPTCLINNVAELSDDPWLVGLYGQRYEFHGRDNVWYAAIADQRLQLNARVGAYEQETFVNGMSLNLFDKGTGEASVSIKVKDPKSFAPFCTLPKDEVCIAEGALEIELDGRKILRPGAYELSDRMSTVHVFNSPWECKAKPDAHFHWDAFHHNRRLLDHLNVHEEILYPHSFHKELFDEDICADWVEQRVLQEDLYMQAGPHTTVLINTPIVELRLEYYLNTDPSWVKHHRFDFFISNYRLPEPTKADKRAGKSNGAVSGILGDTATLKIDKAGHAVLADRMEVLDSVRDEDYEVDGLYGSDFGARKRTGL